MYQVYKILNKENPILKQINSNRFLYFNEHGKNMNYILRDELKIDLGPYHHPLENGHRKWAEILFNYIQEEDLLK